MVQCLSELSVSNNAAIKCYFMIAVTFLKTNAPVLALLFSFLNADNSDVNFNRIQQKAKKKKKVREQKDTMR